MFVEATQQTSSERALAAFPAGSNGEFNLPPDLAVVIKEGTGCRLRTADGREFLDFSMGWGSVLVGHARPEVLAAVREQLPRGTNFACVTEASLQLAERLIDISPACEAVRFCASGTEATMYCLRLARAYSGRSKILKFEGAYHGSHDEGVTSLFPTDPLPFPKSVATSAGLRSGNTSDVLVAPFNDLDTARQIIDEHASVLGGVIVEPLQRCLPPREGFLEGLRQSTHEHDIPLVFDEVVTGFRLALGGAQEYYGVVPDLVAYGKALGGGLPLGAFGGRGDIMDLVREDRMGRETYVWTASSTGGNPVSAAAAMASLNVLQDSEAYPHLHQLGRYLRERMREIIARRQIAAEIIGDGPLAQVIFTSQPVYDYRSSRHEDPTLGRRVMLELFRAGIFLNPMGTKLYLSLAHDERDCDEFCRLFERVLEEIGLSS